MHVNVCAMNNPKPVNFSTVGKPALSLCVRGYACTREENQTIASGEQPDSSPPWGPVLGVPSVPTKHMKREKHRAHIRGVLDGRQDEPLLLDVQERRHRQQRLDCKGMDRNS